MKTPAKIRRYITPRVAAVKQLILTQFFGVCDPTETKCKDSIFIMFEV